jgi:hypothetical protein
MTPLHTSGTLPSEPNPEAEEQRRRDRETTQTNGPVEYGELPTYTPPVTAGDDPVVVVTHTDGTRLRLRIPPGDIKAWRAMPGVAEIITEAEADKRDQAEQQAAEKAAAKAEAEQAAEADDEPKPKRGRARK